MPGGFSKTESPNSDLALFIQLPNEVTMIFGHRLQECSSRPTSSGKGPTALLVRMPLEHDDPVIVEIGDQDQVALDPDLRIVALE